MIWTLLPVFWVLVLVVALYVVLSPVFKHGANSESFRYALKQWKWFWIITTMAALAQSSAALLFKTSAGKTQTTAQHSIVTLNAPPPFSCQDLQKRGYLWYIRGPITIEGTVFSNDVLGPHGMFINKTDIYKFIEQHCGSTPSEPEKGTQSP